MMAVFQLFVRLVDGKTTTLRFNSPTISGESIKNHLHNITRIPPQHQRLLAGGRQIEEETLITADNEDRLFPTVHLLLRLRGGKGGFGSLLRGAATKAGQKKTNNFDACRDMSGRRLRHVNAEKRLEEWKAEAGERKLEKIAEEFIKKKSKSIKKSGSGDSEKYIEKYREDSEKCREEVEASVRESIKLFENAKRKISSGGSGSPSKRLKIWFGKKKMDEGNSDDEDEDNSDNDGEDEKSIVLNDGVRPSEAEGSSDSISGGHSDGESSGGRSSQSNLEEEKGITEQGPLELGGGSEGGEVHGEENNSVELELGGQKDTITQDRSVSGLEVAVPSEIEAVPPEEKCTETVSGSTILSCLEAVEGSENQSTSANPSGSTDSNSAVSNTNILDLEKPLNFDEFSSAAELEVLGMERLKAELQSRGLKCGGTLQERATRLFLLKTTPIEQLPKKLLAKK